MEASEQPVSKTDMELDKIKVMLPDDIGDFEWTLLEVFENNPEAKQLLEALIRERETAAVAKAVAVNDEKWMNGLGYTTLQSSTNEQERT